MSEDLEELKREVEATLQNFPESDFRRLFLIGIGINAPNITQAAKMAQKMGFSRKGQELARKIRKILTKDPADDFLQVLQQIIKDSMKEPEMDKKEAIKKVQNLMKKHGITLEELIVPLDTQIIVLSEYEKITDEVRAKRHEAFFRQIEPIITEKGWKRLSYSEAGIPWNENLLRLHIFLAKNEQLVTLELAGLWHDDFSAFSTFLELEGQGCFLPKLKEFAQEIVEKTGYKVVVH